MTAPTSASDKDAVRTRSTSTLGTATPMLSKRLGITHSSLFLDENTSEGGGKETAAQKKPSRQAQRLKDALRVDVSTPGTAYYASPDRMLLSTAKTTEVCGCGGAAACVHVGVLGARSQSPLARWPPSRAC
jgi:hypothetical protein